MIVLIVEDDAAMRAVLRAYLTREGFEVGGLDLLSLLRRRWPSLPVIVVTAFGGPHVAEEAFAVGRSDTLPSGP